MEYLTADFELRVDGFEPSEGDVAANVFEFESFHSFASAFDFQIKIVFGMSISNP